MLWQASKYLHPDEVASLHALRAYWSPEAKRPKPVDGTATALLDLVRS